MVESSTHNRVTTKASIPEDQLSGREGLLKEVMHLKVKLEEKLKEKGKIGVIETQDNG